MLKPLTSLRFIFALMVFVSHLDFLTKGKSDLLKKIYNSVFFEGYIGVSFFFILSGFILAYNYQDKILTNKKNIHIFYIARFSRIYPLHLLTLIISIPLTYSIFIQNKSLWFSQLITNLTLTQSYFPNRKIYFSFNAPSWSISDEMFFYMFFPFLILLISRIYKLKKIIFISLIGLVPVLTLIIPKNFYHHIFYINPLARIVDFIMGVFLYNFYKSAPFKNRHFNYNFLEILAILLFILFFLFHQSIPIVARYSFYYWVPMSFLIFIFAFQKGKISKFLSKNFFIHLGEISFGFYMFHQLVLRYFLTANVHFLHLENDIIIILLIFIISLLFSHLSYIWYENPVKLYLKKVLSKKII